MYLLIPLCCRLCPEGCVFKPKLLGGQEVTCLCKAPPETNGEEPMSQIVYCAEGICLRLFKQLNATWYSHRL